MKKTCNFNAISCIEDKKTRNKLISSIYPLNDGAGIKNEK